MNKEQRAINRKKKKIVIIVACILALILIFGIIALATFGFKKINEELVSKETNILYYNDDNDEKGEEENKVIVVSIDNKNETNENKTSENTINQNTTSENEVNENTASGNTSNENVVSNESNEKGNTSNKGDNNTKVSEEKPKKQEAKYYIKVNNTANVVTVYKKDSKGKYTVPVKAMICSIGDATPESGVYTMSDKYTWRLLQGDVYGQYACRITGHILFHSVPYEKQDKSTLEWWEYDKLGTKASLGCIRLKVEDAKWIYDNCASGTQVEFYNDSNPGPLGKPIAKKISKDEEVRNWDPTDPDKNNPWPDYLKKKGED